MATEITVTFPCQLGSLSVLNWWILAPLIIAGWSVVQHCPSFIPERTTSHWVCQDIKALPNKSNLSYPWDTLLYGTREYGKQNELFKNVKYSFWSKDEEELLDESRTEICLGMKMFPGKGRRDSEQWDLLCWDIDFQKKRLNTQCWNCLTPGWTKHWRI